MPPDGYETVTLPADLVQQIDKTDLGDSRTSVVRSLIAHYREGETSDSETPAEPSVDTDELATAVADKLEQSDYEDFDDWFSPDVARTIAEHVVEDIDVNVSPVTLEASEYNKIAREVAGELR